MVIIIRAMGVMFTLPVPTVTSTTSVRVLQTLSGMIVARNAITPQTLVVKVEGMVEMEGMVEEIMVMEVVMVEMEVVIMVMEAMEVVAVAVKITISVSSLVSHANK